VAARLLLWDIDGTLVRTGPLGSEVFDLAVADVIGEAPDERVAMSGKTDPLIVTEQLALLGVEPEPGILQAVLDRLVSRLAGVAGRLAERGQACPGVADLLTALAGVPDVACGVLTGNLRPNARVKLAAFGLDDLVDFELGAYGSDDIDRNALVPIAVERAAKALGSEVPADATWVIGDTPRDLECARAGGVRCLLVATGRYGIDELTALGPDAVLPDLTDTPAVVELLTGAR
jgi:phosphoglycolate phosphatase-like HAD superfamily hydrolase